MLSSMPLMRLFPSFPNDLISVGVTSACRAAPSGAVRRRDFWDSGGGQSETDRSRRRAALALWLPGNRLKEAAVAMGVEGRLAGPVSEVKAVMVEEEARGRGGGRFSLKSPCSMLRSWMEGALGPEALAGWRGSSVVWPLGASP